MADYTIPQFPMKRLRYFNNQFLTEKDFIDDQAAHLSHERAQLRALCAPGVLEGMVAAFNTATTPLTISAGVALDNQGRLIAIDTTANGASPSGLNGDYFLHVRYNEASSDAAVNVGGSGAAGDTRWHSEPLFGATLKTANLPDGAIVLGSFQATSGSISQSSVTMVGRQHAGLRLPSPPPPQNLTPPAPPPATLTYRNDGSFDGAQLNGTLAIQKTVATAIGPSLTLTNANPTPNGPGVNAGAVIDFNACDPAGNAPSLRLQSIGDGTGSSALSVLTKNTGGIGNSLVERLRIAAGGTVQVAGALTANTVQGTGLTGLRTTANGIGPTLTLTNPNSTPGGAGTGAGAAIDFNPYDPGVNPPALRIQSIGDGTGSSDLVVLTKGPGGVGNALAERLRVTAAGAVQVAGGLTAASLSTSSFTGAVNFTGAVSASSLHVANTTDAGVTPPVVHGDYLGNTRSLVDHNGYRMGQVSEMDEHWLATTTTVKLALTAGLVTAGTPSLINAQWNFNAAGQTVIVPIGGIPAGALITSIVACYNRGSTDALQFFVEVGSQLGFNVTPFPQYAVSVAAGGSSGGGTLELLPVTGANKAAIPVETIQSVTSAGAAQVRIVAGASPVVVSDIQVTYVIPGPNWSAKYRTTGRLVSGSAVSDDRIVPMEPDATINQRTLQLISSTVNGITGSTEVFAQFEAFFDAKTVYIMEFILRTGTIVTDISTDFVRFGIQFDTSNEFVGITNWAPGASPGNSNWALLSPGFLTNTGVAYTPNTTYRVRFELAGGSVNGSGVPRARCCMNGVIALERSLASMTGKVRPYFKVSTPSSGGPFDYRIGRVRRVWNHLLVGDNL